MKKDLVTKMTIIGVVGLVGLTLVILGIWAIGRPAKSQVVSNKEEEIKKDNGLGVESDDEIAYQRSLAVIQEMSDTDNELTLYDITTEQQVTVKVSGAVSIKSAYGEDLAFSQLNLGDMIDIKYNKKDYKPKMIKISGRVWERSDTKAMVVDEKNNRIRLANDVYDYNEHLVVASDRQRIRLKDISASDDLVLRGDRKKIWSIILRSAHGKLRLLHADAYIDGMLEIGNRQFQKVTKDMVVKVPAGVAKVVISKENMTPYSAEVFVEEGKEVVVDLSDYQPKVAKVDFDIVQKEATLFIDGEKKDKLDEPLTLDFGDYRLRVEKSNFMPWEKTLTVNQAYMKVKIDMKEEPQYIEVQTPIGAELYLDAAKVGTIPVKTAIKPGTHTLTIRKAGYYSKMQSVTIQDNGQNVNYAFPDLIKIPANPSSGDNQDQGNDKTPPNPLNPTEDTY